MPQSKNLHHTLFIPLLILLLLGFTPKSVNGGSTIKHTGKIQYLNHGVIDGKYSISVKFFDDDKYYYYSADTSQSDTLYQSLIAKFSRAVGKEATAHVISDSNNIKGLELDTIEMETYKSKHSIIRAWKQPAGAHNAYQKGDTVVGYVSLIDNNVWQPFVAFNYWESLKYKGISRRWRKPEGAHNCFNNGIKMSYKRATYQSLINGNIWPPNEYPEGWKQLTGKRKVITSTQNNKSSKDRPKPKAWAQPKHDTDGYKYGNLVIYKGVTYKSVVPQNLWAPDVARNYWEVVSGTPPILEWNSPKGIFDCYHKDNRVKFEGKIYKSLNNSNMWSPKTFPTGWQEVKK